MNGLVMQPGRLLERTRVFTPLGIRFWDAALDLPVTDGLLVQAWRLDADHAPVTALRSPSGVYGFHGLPGLRDIEYPETEVEPELFTPRADFAITVDDTQRRFLPMLFVVRLPLPYRGIFLAAGWSSPPLDEGRAFLFSAPSRQLPETVATLRADLWDLDLELGAAHAAVRVELEGVTYTGIADEQGRVLVAFPYPSLEQLRIGSPPGSGQAPAADTQWPLTIRVHHLPIARPPLEQRGDAPRLWQHTPSVKSVLTDQLLAPIWEDELLPPAETLTATLQYGEPVILRTRAFASQGRLWLHGTSPP